VAALFAHPQVIGWIGVLQMFNIAGVIAFAQVTDNESIFIQLVVPVIIAAVQALLGLVVWQTQRWIAARTTNEQYAAIQARARTFVLAVGERGKRGDPLFRVGEMKKDVVRQAVINFARLMKFNVTEEDIDSLIDAIVLELLNSAKSATLPES
jgi:hypothetical protein